MKLKKLTHEQREEIVMRAKDTFDSKPKETFVEFMGALGSFNRVISEMFEEKKVPSYQQGGMVAKLNKSEIMLNREVNLNENLASLDLIEPRKFKT
jgi:hypothetical protein